MIPNLHDQSHQLYGGFGGFTRSAASMIGRACSDIWRGSSPADRGEYLRNLGALDEIDPKRPTGVFPNYMTSHTVCMESSGFYSIGCFDDCEGLLRQLERELAAPIAESTPAI